MSSYISICEILLFLKVMFSVSMSEMSSAVLSEIIGPARYPAIALFSDCILSTNTSTSKSARVWSPGPDKSSLFFEYFFSLTGPCWIVLIQVLGSFFSARHLYVKDLKNNLM